jgi:hypothetical protein
MVARLAADVLEGGGTHDHETETAVRIIWTADYLDVVARLESAIVAPVQELRRDVAGT